MVSDAAMRQADALERERLIAKAMPLRLARMNAARPTFVTATESVSTLSSTLSTTLRDTLQYMALQRYLHDAKQIRYSYWDGGN